MKKKKLSLKKLMFLLNKERIYLYILCGFYFPKVVSIPVSFDTLSIGSHESASAS